MKRIVFSAMAACMIVSACATAQDGTGLSKKEKKAGWKQLFDGKTLTGWHQFHAKPGSTPAWKAVDGTLFLDTDAKASGASGGDLVTNEDYENFEFEYEWKISPNGNSGVMFGVNEDKKYGATYSTGPEMQVIDDAGHPDGKNKKHNSGELYDMIAAPKFYAKPVGEWNKAKIIKKDGKITLFLNGEKTAETTMGTPEWQELLNNSKFKTWKGFGEYPKGKIALQDHGDKVWYRNLKIRQL
ncbi:DUF1080 domain-containing protein [Chitinophaga horti]|uniref:DUF1080 domain-containing protein n=1 Tax=Chitinophaga horti TaxID=2920382 RepID=A0ABY6IXH6_9BACT|nr:DUF1080 domain-containing protein [Chitinophaga horti]UYQ92093.1 DUF1080 domain-containing protein [Chitinophaga horti]